MYKKNIFAVIVIFLFSSIICSYLQAQEVRKVQVGKPDETGKFVPVLLGDYFNDNILPNLGTVTFAVPWGALDDKSIKVSLKITGSGSKSVINGKDKKTPGVIVTNAPKRKIHARRIEIEGSPKLKGKLDYVNVVSLVKTLIKKENVDKDKICDPKKKSEKSCYFSKDTSLSGTLGKENELKVVVADGAKLTLKNGFEGYGVLVLTGKGKSNTRLVMENGAIWHGLIISDIGCVDYKDKGVIIEIGRSGVNPLPLPGLRKFRSLINKTGNRLAGLIVNSAFARPLIKPLPPIDKKGGIPGKIPKLPPPEDKDKNKAKVFGAIILGGAQPQLKLGDAEIKYDSAAIKKVENKLNNLKKGKFIWKNWQEKED